MNCTACGHDDPHTKNGGCGSDVRVDANPPFFLQCMCDGESGMRIMRFWSAVPLDGLREALEHLSDMDYFVKFGEWDGWRVATRMRDFAQNALREGETP